MNRELELKKDDYKVQEDNAMKNVEVKVTNDTWRHQDETDGILKEIANELHRFSTIVNLPTGSGKTKIAIDFCEWGLAKGEKVLWLGHRIDILEQSRKKFLKAIEEVMPNCKTQILSGKSDHLKDIKPDTNVIFASVLTLCKVADKHSKAFQMWLDSSEKVYIIYDECHHCGAKTAEKLLQSLICPQTKESKCKVFYNIKKFGLIGLTATVYRGDRYLEVFYKYFKHGYNKKTNKVCFIPTEYGDNRVKPSKDWMDMNRIAVVGVRELVKRGVLLAPEIHCFMDFQDGVPKDIPTYIASKVDETWGKSMIFVRNVNEAEKVKDRLIERGFNAFTYTYKDNSNKKKKFESFCIEGKCKDEIVIVVGKADEGVDIPDLETIYLFAKTESHIILRQRVGRVLRNPEKTQKVGKVFWQYYPNKKSKKRLQDKILKTMEEQLLDAYDYETNKTSANLPATMYLIPINDKGIVRKEYDSTYIILQIMKVFGLKRLLAAESLGCYYSKRDVEWANVIYVTEKERVGYERLTRVLKSDSWRNMGGEMFKCFEDYRIYRGISEEDLLTDIKRVCFYLNDVQKSDMTGKGIQPRLYVSDDDIKMFCDWYFNNELNYSEIDKSDDFITDMAKKEGLLDDESEEDEDDEDGEEIDTLDDLDCDREDLNSYSEYLNEHDEGFIHDNEDC